MTKRCVDLRRDDAKQMQLPAAIRELSRSGEAATPPPIVYVARGPHAAYRRGGTDWTPSPAIAVCMRLGRDGSAEPS